MWVVKPHNKRLVLTTDKSKTAVYHGSIRTDNPTFEDVPDYIPAMLQPLSKATNVLMVGLGGCDALRYARKHLPNMRFTVIEKDQPVIDLAREHFRLDKHKNLDQLIHADAKHYFAIPPANPTMFDGIVVDAFDECASRPVFYLPKHFLPIIQHLKPGASLTANFFGTSSAFQGIRLEKLVIDVDVAMKRYGKCCRKPCKLTPNWVFTFVKASS